jgi:hypothetical protein
MALEVELRALYLLDNDISSGLHTYFKFGIMSQILFQ